MASLELNLTSTFSAGFFTKKRLKRDGGWLLCDEPDFERMRLPSGWYVCETKLGGAVQIQFPVRVKGSVWHPRASGAFLNGFPQECLHIYFLARGVIAEA